MAALLALAVPASVARSSLVGAYVVIALLAGLAVAAVVWTARGRRAALTRIGVLTVLYAVAVTVIHVAG